MAKIVLVVGGSRSGKSDFAQGLAEREVGERFYLATCPPPQGDDPEMAARVLAHQQGRIGRGWQTREESLHLASLVSTLPSDATILLDCLSLWVSNLLLADEEGTLDEARMSLLAQGLLEASQGRSGTLIMVTSEVGCGLVPEHPLSRRFRDLVGRCNQVMAAEAEQVFQVVCGIAVAIK